MNHTEKEKFESLWNDFLTLTKGKLMRTINKHSLSTPLANLILSETAGVWGVEYEVYGRWLKNLRENNSSKAKLISNILFNDMRFTEVKPRKEIPSYCKFIIPVIGAFAGYAITHHFEYSKLTQTISFITPAVLLYPIVQNFRKNQIEKNKEKLISQYLEQLEKFKNSILSILS